VANLSNDKSILSLKICQNVYLVVRILLNIMPYFGHIRVDTTLATV